MVLLVIVNGTAGGAVSQSVVLLVVVNGTAGGAVSQSVSGTAGGSKWYCW